MMIRFSTFAAAIVGASLIAAPLAFASEEIDAALKDKVTAAMTAQGYEVRKVQKEDGMIEVYAVKGGKTYELYLDDQLKIVKTGGSEG
jgi:Peptidase propeptide and YPEB domain